MWLGTTTDVEVPTHFQLLGNTVVATPEDRPPRNGATLDDVGRQNPLTKVLGAVAPVPIWVASRYTTFRGYEPTAMSRSVPQALRSTPSVPDMSPPTRVEGKVQATARPPRSVRNGETACS